MPLPRMTEEEKLAVIRALQASNEDAEYPGFHNHADRYGPYVITGYWCPSMAEFPGYTVTGPGPVIVDTRDYSVQYHGSTLDGRPAWFAAADYPQGHVKLADEPIPGHPTSDLPDDDS